MFCPSCGSNVENGLKFCTQCGADVTANSNVATAPKPPSANPSYNQSSYAPPPPPPPQYGYQAPAYQPPAYQAPNYQVPPVDNSPMSVGQYLITFIILAIPIVGFIMLLMWAFGSNVNKNKQNFCRASLILAAIGIVLGILFSVVLGSVFAALIGSMSGGYSYY